MKLASGAGAFRARPPAHQLKDFVYEELRDAIVGLRLAPGQPLREAALSAELGVSKTPVREALVRLEQEGLVRLEAYKGATVAGYSRSDLLEIYQLRELLEGACARHAALARPPALLAALARVVSDSRTALQQEDVEQLTELFDRFDALLFEQLPNRRIRVLLDNLQCHLIRIGKLTMGIAGRPQTSVTEHAEIYQAIQEGEADAAERLMRAHFRSVLHDQLTSTDQPAAPAPG